MASQRRKSAAIALAFVGIAGLSLASASQLNLTSSTLQAGTTVLADCQISAIPVTFTTGVVGGVYKVTGVVLSGVQAPCVGKTLTVKVLDASATPVEVASVVGTAVAGANTVAVDLTAAQVKTVAAMITG